MRLFRAKRQSEKRVLDTTFTTTNIQGPVRKTKLWRNGQKGRQSRRLSSVNQVRVSRRDDCQEESVRETVKHGCVFLQ